MAMNLRLVIENFMKVSRIDTDIVGVSHANRGRYSTVCFSASSVMTTGSRMSCLGLYSSDLSLVTCSVRM